MSNILDKIEKEIFKLNNQERAFLADRLLGSLENDAMTDVDEAWIAEAESRYQKYKKGERPGIDAQVVFGEADQILK